MVASDKWLVKNHLVFSVVHFQVSSSWAPSEKELLTLVLRRKPQGLKTGGVGWVV